VDEDFSAIQNLIDRPGESLSVEIKSWINPDSEEGKAKIVRAAFALRNYGGGYLIIGFNDVTLLPDEENRPEDVKSCYHADKIQGMIARYASDPFSITIFFPERDGKPFPVLAVPPGVKIPVACKADLHVGGTRFLNADEVLCRTLRSNNTPSTARASWKDWGQIMDVCFENREADIGRFLRRHLSGVAPEAIRSLAGALDEGSQPVPKPHELLFEILNQGNDRFLSLVNERKLELPAHGCWEAGLLIVGSVPAHVANGGFLNLLDSSNPDYTGWPVWLVNNRSTEQDARPFVYDGAWEELLVHLAGGWSDHIDFMRFDPRGRFYIRRAFQDDIGGSSRAPEPMKAFDFGLGILRTAETIAVGVAFAKAMGCKLDTTQLAFGFRWSKLQGRVLSSWAQPLRYISPHDAYQDQVFSDITVPLDVPLSSLGEYVGQAIRPLFEVFSGFSIGQSVVNEMTDRLISRAL
jgi:hypothetical protein